MNDLDPIQILFWPEEIGSVHLISIDVACVSGRSKVQRPRKTVCGKFLASSSVLSICFGSRIAVKQSSAPLLSSPLDLLTGETLKLHVVGPNYMIE